MTHHDQATRPEADALWARCDICTKATDSDNTSTTEDGYLFCTDCGDTRVRWIHDDRQGESYAYRY